MHALSQQVYWQKKRSMLSLGVIKTRLSRPRPFLFFPNLTLECCNILQQSLLALTVMSAVVDKVASPLTMDLVQLELRGMKKSATSPIYRINSLLRDALISLFLLVSGARTPSELNMRYIRPYCRMLAHMLQSEKIRETWPVDITLNYLLRYASLWSQLTIEHKCYVYCGNVYIAHWLFEFGPRQILSNQFILDACRETILEESTPGMLKPNPSVIRAAVDVFADKLHQCGKRNASDSLLKIFKMWPSPDKTKQLYGNYPQT